MNWHILNSIEELDSIVEESASTPVVIFKHSTKCSISSMAKNRFERQWNYEDADIKPYFLDLIAKRDISNQIAETFGVEHQSPQVLLIKDGKCVYNDSHNGISVPAIGEHI